MGIRLLKISFVLTFELVTYILASVKVEHYSRDSGWRRILADMPKFKAGILLEQKRGDSVGSTVLGAVFNCIHFVGKGSIGHHSKFILIHFSIGSCKISYCINRHKVKTIQTKIHNTIIFGPTIVSTFHINTDLACSHTWPVKVNFGVRILDRCLWYFGCQKLVHKIVAPLFYQTHLLLHWCWKVSDAENDSKNIDT